MALALTADVRVARAQELRFLYPAPPSGQVIVVRDVDYAPAGGDRRLMDVYRPARVAPNSAAPAFIVFSAFATSQRREPQPAGWGLAAASNGLVGVVPDIRPAHAAEDVDAVLSYLVRHAADLGIDANAVALCAASGNVQSALPLVEDPHRTGIHAAIMLYGSAPVHEFRRDLPVLLVRAGLDRPDVNRSVADVAAEAIAQNAPITLLNHATGHHGFELTDDDAATRSTIDAVFAFVKRATAPGYRAASRAAEREAAAAGAFMTGQYALATEAFGALAREHPADARLRLSYGEALLSAQRYADACAEFERLKGASLGARDLGVPAARACALSGDAVRSIGWLRTIPKRFLPPSLENDPALSSLREREDFRALFR
jgi:hypothetical protein